jgi:hypothetical protein
MILAMNSEESVVKKFISLYFFTKMSKTALELTKTQRKNRNRREKQKLQSSCTIENDFNANENSNEQFSLVPVKWKNNINFLKFALLLSWTPLQMEMKEKFDPMMKQIDILTHHDLFRKQLLDTGEEWVKEVITKNPKVDPTTFVDKVRLTIPPEILIQHFHCNFCKQNVGTCTEWTCDNCGWVYYCSEKCKMADAPSNNRTEPAETKDIAPYHQRLMSLSPFENCAESFFEAMVVSYVGDHREYCGRLKRLLHEFLHGISTASYVALNSNVPMQYPQKTTSFQFLQEEFLEYEILNPVFYFYHVQNLTPRETYMVIDSASVGLPERILKEHAEATTPKQLSNVRMDEYFQLTTLVDWLCMHYAPCVLVLECQNKFFMKDLSTAITSCSSCKQAFSPSNPLTNCLICTCGDSCSRCWFGSAKKLHEKSFCAQETARLHMILPFVYHRKISLAHLTKAYPIL